MQIYNLNISKPLFKRLLIKVLVKDTVFETWYTFYILDSHEIKRYYLNIKEKLQFTTESSITLLRSYIYLTITIYVYAF